MNEFLPAYQIQKEFSISTSTLRNWATNNKIRYTRLGTDKGKRLYNINDIKEIFCKRKNNFKNVNCKNDKVLIYARVSSSQQKDDLQRQVDILSKKYPDADIIKDIGSTLNYKRKGLTLLLDRAYKRDFNKLVILYKDRLCRFAFDLFTIIFRQQNIEIEVVSDNDDSLQEPINSQFEMEQDLLAIVDQFVSKNNGLRSGKNKKRRQETINQLDQKDKI